MNNAILLNQYNLQAGTNKNSKLNSKANSSEKSKAESSFAAEMKAVEEKSTAPTDTVPAENESSLQKDKTKKIEKIAEELAAQLAQLDLGEEDQQKLKALLEDNSLLKAGDSLEHNEAQSFLAKLSASNENNLEALISDLNSFIEDSEVDLTKNKELSALVELTAELKQNPDLEAESRAFKEKYENYFQSPKKLKTEAETTDKKLNFKNSKKANSENNSYFVLKSEVEKPTAELNLEQKTLLKDNQKTEKTTNNLKENSLLEAENNEVFQKVQGLEQNTGSKLSSEELLNLTTADPKKEEQIIKLDFSAVDSAAEQKLKQNAELNSFANKANLKAELPVKEQFVQKFSGEYSAAKNEMNIELEPESLGKIEVKLNLEQGKVNAKMLVESKVVQAQLESSMQDIKSDLLKQGINIEQFKVETIKNAPRQVEQHSDFNLSDQNSAFSDGETGENQEYQQRQFFQGQYYLKRNLANKGLNGDDLIMRQQEIINRAAFSKAKLNLIV